MNYNGIELKEFTSDRPVTFDPPKKMLVWDEIMDTPLEVKVCSYMPAWRYPVGTSTQTFCHCAEIPEEPKPRRATNIELMKWLPHIRGCGLPMNLTPTWQIGFVMRESSSASGTTRNGMNPPQTTWDWRDKR